MGGLIKGIWLASASQRRAEILTKILTGRPVWFTNSPLVGEESPPKTGVPVEDIVSQITLEKARTAALETSLGRLGQLSWRWMGGESSPTSSFFPSPEDVVVVVADTMVGDPDDAFVPLGQPEDELSAAGMLIRLSNRRHQVWSGTTFSGAINGKWVESATVQVDELSEEILSSLLKSGSWKGKAGGYDLGGEMGGHANLVSGDELTVLGFAGEAIKTLKNTFELLEI